MKISMEPRTSLVVAGSDRSWVIIAAAAILAAAIGLSIAGTNWILTVALLALPILMLRPRELCLGGYAVLLPFDSITGVGPGGQTLTRIVGAAAATILLGTALLRKDYKRP